ncbi:MAG: hypothetical protein QMD80_02145 [archaeon]|nr:hypothetical protein [archaeon]MDI6884862.1 hypothetical protein [archaeon]
MDTGKVFLGAVFLIVAIYIFVYVTGPAAKFFGGGIMAILGLLTLLHGFKEKK